MDDSQPIKLQVSERSLSTLSFAMVKPEAIKDWASDLPKANIGQCAKQLFSALQEINKLDTDPNTRFAILEAIRPMTYYVVQALSKHFLNQSIVLNDQQSKVANLVQALQTLLATGYECVIMDVFDSPQAQEDLLASAIHRCLAELSRKLLRAYQFYASMPARLWFDLGQLYRLAEDNSLLGYSLNDEYNRYKTELSIDTLFKRAALLASAKTNQLRQRDLETLFELLESWAELSEVKPLKRADDEAMFALDLDNNKGPCYFSLYEGRRGAHTRAINNPKLIAALMPYLDSNAEDSERTLDIPQGIRVELIQHVAHAWGPLKQRAFKRVALEGKLETILGLSACHYYISGEKDFADCISRGRGRGHARSTQTRDKFLKSGGKNDAWARSFDADTHDLRLHSPVGGEEIQYHNPNDDKAKPTDYPIHKTQLENTSPGGYCLRWPTPLPPQVQAGELLGVREHAKQNWSLAAIRWVRVLNAEKAILGVELLTPNAKPCGVTVLRKTNVHSETMRGFLLPEISALAQPTTLLLPGIPFQSGNKIMLNQAGDEDKGQLGKQLLSTASFSQFQFKLFTPNAQGPQDRKPAVDEEDFSSLWRML